MERDPLLPSHIIELKSEGMKCSEWQIEKFGRAGQRSVFSLERIDFVVYDNVILARDLWYGSAKKFVPKLADPSVRLLRYVHLVLDRGFVLYDTPTSTKVSVVSLDFDALVYELIGDSYQVIKHLQEPGHSVYVDDVSGLSQRLITVKTEDSLFGAKIHVFKVNYPLNNVTYVNAIPVPDYCQWFGLVDKTVMFASFNPEDKIDRCYLDNFMVLQLDGELNEVKKSATCLQSRTPLQETIIYPCGLQGRWYRGRFFVLCNFCPGKRTEPTTVFFSVYEGKTNKWSELRLKLPQLDHGYVKFHIDYNGILNILHHVEVYENGSDELDHTDVTLYRFPLTKPEALAKLAWFTIRRHGLLADSQYPQNFPFKPIFD